MADNTTLDAGSGGDTIRTEDRTTYKTPVSLIDVGGTSGESIIGDTGVYMPVEGAAAHDAASAGNPIMVGAEFDDTTPDSVDEGDVGKLRMSANRNLYTTIRDAAGNERGLNVDASGNITVNLSSTDNTVLDNINTNTTNLQNCIVQDDAPFTPATGYLMMIGGEFDDAATDSVDEGDAGSLRISANRCAYVNIRDNAGNERGLNIDASGNLTANITGTVTVGSHAVTNAGTFAVQEDGPMLTEMQTVSGAINAEDSAHTSTDSGMCILGVRQDGDTSPVSASGDYQTLIFDNTGRLKVGDGGSSLSVDFNGTAPTIGAGVEANAVLVTIATDSTGVVSVDDNSGSLTVDASQLDIDDLAPTADGVAAALDTSQIMNGLTALTPKYAIIDAASSGDNTLVSAVVGKKIRVLALMIVASGAVNVRLEDGAGGTALTGQMNLTTNSGFTLPFCPVGWFETTANTLLNLELSGATSVDGNLVYVEV